jgi:hypothetical protein
LVTFDSGLKRHPVLERATKQRCCASLHELRAAPKRCQFIAKCDSTEQISAIHWSASQIWGISSGVTVSHVMLLSPIWEILKST